MKNKFTRLVVCFLYLATIIPFSVSSNETTNKTIYVDDDNTDGPWDGSMEHPYQYIRDGIDAAVDGDTVFVYNGLYFESVVVDKSINLIGEDRNNTIIDGNYYFDSIHITAKGVKITGFMVRKSGRKGIYVHEVQKCTIMDNTILGNSEGIIIAADQEVNNRILITRNSLSHNYYGISIYRCFGINITENIFFKNSVGACVVQTDKINLIYRNNFTRNSFGVELWGCSFCKVIQNNFIQNSDHATFYYPRVNVWNRNYWDDWCGIGPKVIWGRLFIIWRVPPLSPPWFQFDWHPAREPYDIP
jgi:parallel beta-helix repeat protein